MQTGLATIENIMEVSQNFKVKLSYESAVLLLNIYQKKRKKKKTRTQKDICTPMFTAVLFTIINI